MRRLTVTIDTNSINAKCKDLALNQLEQWHQNGLIEIKRTRVLAQELTRDQSSYYGPLRRQKAQAYQEGTSAFTMGRSEVGGGDALRAPNAYQWEKPITALLDPTKDPIELNDKDQRDILHLAIHKAYGWDYFVTLDTRGIFRYREGSSSRGNCCQITGSPEV